MNRILKPFIVMAAAIYFVADVIFATIATPLARWIGEQRVFAGLESTEAWQMVRRWSRLARYSIRSTLAQLRASSGLPLTR